MGRLMTWLDRISHWLVTPASREDLQGLLVVFLLWLAFKYGLWLWFTLSDSCRKDSR